MDVTKYGIFVSAKELVRLQWNAARLAFVSGFLMSLMRVKTVNMSEIATGFGRKAETDSH